MSENGKYFYIMLKQDFFASDEMAILQTYPESDKLIVFYLKLLLKSLKWNGRLLVNENLPMTKQMICGILNIGEEEFDCNFDILESLGLAEITESRIFSFPTIQNYIGTSSVRADKQRKLDRKQKSVRNLSENCQKSVDIHSNSQRHSIESEQESKKEKKIEIEEEVAFIDLDYFWKLTREAFPKKNGFENGFEKWKERILSVSGSEQEKLALQIIKDCEEYKRDYRMFHHEDARCNRAKTFLQWFKYY